MTKERFIRLLDWNRTQTDKACKELDRFKDIEKVNNKDTEIFKEYLHAYLRLLRCNMKHEYLMQIMNRYCTVTAIWKGKDC